MAGKVGKPPHEPTAQTRKTVQAMSAYGITQAEICKVLGIDVKTLHKYYRQELDTATAYATAKVAENLFKRATSDKKEAVTAAIFWLKTRAGWKETQVIEQQPGDAVADALKAIAEKLPV